MAAINRANHACIRLNPYGVQTMKQSYASAGKAPRRRVHSLSGIAAIAECGLPPPRIVIGYPAHQAQSGAEPFLSFLVIECCSRRRPQLDTVRHLASRDQAPQRDQQLARQCHDHRRLARAARPLGPRAIPLRQRTVFLETSGSATSIGSAHVVPAHCRPWPGPSLGVSNRSRRAIP